MGYACPVCETPQRDAEHLANHLAFTAMLHGDAHEDWLDEHAPGWADRGEADLAPVVADHATEVPYDEVFDEGHDHDAPAVPERSQPRGDALDDDARRALSTAREMTREMLEGGEDDGTADGTDDADDGKA